MGVASTRSRDGSTGAGGDALGRGRWPSRPRSTVLEIGSHQGRSTVVLGDGVPAHRRAGDRRRPVRRGPALRRGVDPRQVRATHRRGRADRRRGAASPSTAPRLRPTWSRPFDLLYIDGKHDYWTLSDDLRWSSHLPAGGGVLVHDCFSSIGVTLGILRARAVLAARSPTSGEPARWRCSASAGPRPADRRADPAPSSPGGCATSGVKVLLRLRLRPVAADCSGHDGPYDPY